MKKALLSFCILLAIQAYAQRELKTENLFIITLDGFRWQELFTGADSLLIGNADFVDNPDELVETFWQNDPIKRREILMPFFWSIIKGQGQIYGNRFYGNKVNCSNQMWFSYPGYNEILTGFHDDKNINSNDKIPNPNVTVLEFFNNQKELKDKVAAFCSWDVFPYIINEERSGVPVNAGFDHAEGKHLTERELLLNELITEIRSPWNSVRLDAFTHHFALEHIKKNQPKVVYISYGETDDFAHDGKYDEYLKSAHQTDEFIKDLFDYVQSTDQYRDKTTFLITTDHGRGTIPIEYWKHHSAKIKGADQTWIAVIGPDTEAKGEIKEEMQLFQNQIAKTAAAFMGLDFSISEDQGNAVQRMFK